MTNIFKSARLPECFLVVALGFLGFKFSEIPTNIEALVVLFFIILSTMLQNDWRDRVHDINKGKTFAHNKPKQFIVYVVLMWMVSFGSILQLSFSNPLVSGILLVMAIVGLFYSEARHVPFLSVTLVTITVASSTLLPLGFGSSFGDIALLFFTTACIMFGRETLHDINDVRVDIGYKKTIPVIIGDTVARISSMISLLIGCILAIIISPLNIISVCFILWGLSIVLKDPLVTTVRKRIDIGLVLLALTFVLL